MNSIKKKAIDIVNKLPYVRGLVKRLSYYNSVLFFPPEHYYSPIISKQEVKSYENKIWPEPVPDKVSDVDLYSSEQLALLNSFKKFKADFIFPTNPQENYNGYYLDNPFFTYNDAYVLYSIIRHFSPKNIIEIGSGFSSAIMLEVNEKFFNNSISLTFIEPFPEERLNNFLSSGRKCIKLVQKIQEVDVSVFDKLSVNDILFIDSSHVSKTGSDLNFILFEILPFLKSGVIIHFHDIFYPFEYPKDWVYKGRSWNEAYMLRALLSNNNMYKILFFNDYLNTVHPESTKEIPALVKSKGSSLWIQKTN